MGKQDGQMGKNALLIIVFSVSVVAQASSLVGNSDTHPVRTQKTEIFNGNYDEHPIISEYKEQRSIGAGSRSILHDLMEELKEQKDDTEQNSGLLKNNPEVRLQSVGNILPNAEKGTRQFPCPDGSAIAPCACRYDESENMHMNCTSVETEEQLTSVFQAEFPIKSFTSFYMGPNEDIKFFGDIFNGVTFEEVEIVRATNLELVSQYWLQGSRSTLKYLAIAHSKLHSETFPFISMDAYTKLETLYITYSSITMLPPLHSKTLTEVAFEASNIATVQPVTFQNITNLTYINLGDNNISVISADTFRLVDAPSSIYLYQNSIETIEAGAFVLPSDPNKLSLLLHVGVNKLTTLEEEVYGPVFPYITKFEVYGNPLECGCDMAWLVTDRDNLAKVGDWAQCADGTNIHDLDPMPFVNFC